MIIRWLAVLLTMSSGASSGPGAQIPTDAASGAPACVVDPVKLRGICNDVYSRTPDTTNPDIWTYRYEQKIYAASCVDFSKDTPRSARSKIQKLWNEHQAHLKCDALNFSVQQGSILKYAVQIENYSVVDNAVKNWKLDLNIIDSSDNRTLLDFVEARYAANHGSSAADTLENYWNLLRRNGAKRCREVDPARRCNDVNGTAVENLERRFAASRS